MDQNWRLTANMLYLCFQIRARGQWGFPGKSGQAYFLQSIFTGGVGPLLRIPRFIVLYYTLPQKSCYRAHFLTAPHTHRDIPGRVGKRAGRRVTPPVAGPIIEGAVCPDVKRALEVFLER